jgi:hypothetical protein
MSIINASDWEAEQLKQKLSNNIIWCSDGTCQFKNVIVPSDTLARSMQTALYQDAVESYMYPSAGSQIWQNIFDAKNQKVIEKIGNPNAYDETTYTVGKEWNSKPIIQYGWKSNPDGNGMLVHVPNDAEVIWVRILNDRWVIIKAQIVSSKEIIGRFVGGFRNLVNYTPDGTMGNDGFWNLHTWVPIPLPKSGLGDVILTSSTEYSDFWVSGIGFSRNPWKHAMNSALAYHWNVNTPGTPADNINNDASKTGIAWETENWNNDVLMRIQNNIGKADLYVPVVPSGRDKLVYAMEHNNNWLGTGHVSLSVNDKPIERFRTSYNNPFARNFNGKMYSRYIAAKIPASYIAPTDRFIKLTINMTGTNHNLYFREVGTHDLIPDVPAASYAYVGCYQDCKDIPSFGTRALPTLISQNIKSVDECYNLVKSKNDAGSKFTYFGTQDNNECWASDNTNWKNFPVAPDADCKYTCTGTGGQGNVLANPQCGTSCRNAIWKIL